MARLLDADDERQPDPEGGAEAAADAPALVTCEENVFLDNILSDFSTQQAGAVYFGLLANYNIFRGDVGAGIVDLGTGNVVLP